ncbi:hypothetical protein DL89DRAFT_171818 [Linderina pennispora]|uniref:Cation-transporting P-type ATPase C-terminal domain-containing protein n=1 Tax=Linderina pennispora TaxID=61395 RepID=A0A1Y1W7I1_9FUNG|nr:uncharacterized protein DL89DRAFT_171818 [Linderina pennispora]ORX69114.1 hypothetical protein DL89DRAFT_171818 [Linderina pennispora]
MFVMATQMVLIPTTVAVDPIIWLWQGDIALMADVEMMYSRQRNVPRIFDNKVLRLVYYCSVSIIDVMTSLNGCFGMGVSLSLYLAHLGWLTVFDTGFTLLALVNLAVICVKLYAKNASQVPKGGCAP